MASRRHICLTCLLVPKIPRQVQEQTEASQPASHSFIEQGEFQRPLDKNTVPVRKKPNPKSS